jgi:hypothetical protein
MSHLSTVGSGNYIYEGRYGGANDGNALRSMLRHGLIARGVDRDAWDADLWRVHRLIEMGYGDIPRHKIPPEIIAQAEGAEA